MSKLRLFVLAVFLLVALVSAEDYLERMRELDARILCFLLFAGPLVALFLLGIGGLFFIASQSPERKESARNLIYNALLGLIILIIVIFGSAYIAKIDLGKCVGGSLPSQPQLSCADIFNDCNACIDNKCAFCLADKRCYSRVECKDKCYSGSMPADCAFTTDYC